MYTHTHTHNTPMHTMDDRLMTPMLMSIFASRGSGKTVFAKNLLLNQKLLREPFKKIFWVYKSWQDEIFDELSASINIEFREDIPLIDSKQENTLVVLDDIMAEAADSDLVRDMYIRGRHLNLSVMYLSQNL